MEGRGHRLFFILVSLVGACGAVLVLDRGSVSGRANAAFQKQVGGLGFGPALDLGGCPFGLDPRLDGGCAEDVGPIPAGGCFCPQHGGLLASPPERRQAVGAMDDALPPRD